MLALLIDQPCSLSFVFYPKAANDPKTPYNAAQKSAKRQKQYKRKCFEVGGGTLFQACIQRGPHCILFLNFNRDYVTVRSKYLNSAHVRWWLNCRAHFDAGVYDRNGMRAMLDRYLQLLGAAAHEPELPIGKLLAMTGAKPLRWTCRNYAERFYESSTLLKLLWRRVRRLTSSSVGQ